MFTKPFALIVAVAALSVSALDIDTPAKLTQCGAVEIKWTGKNAPFILSVLPGCDADSEDPLVELAPMNATSYKWTVNLPSSTGAVAFAITDSKGNEAYTDEVTIQKSDNTACFSGASSSVSSSAASTATSTFVGTSTDAPRTTLVVSGTQSTAAPSAPVNVGSGSSLSNGSSGSSGTTNDANANGAVAPIASALAGMVGVATALFVIL